MGIPVLDYPMYEVDETGDIYSKYTGKALKTNIARTGYHSVELFNEKGSRRVLVHRIVAQAFIPNPFNLPQVNHIDENKANNAASNLEWCTAKYNMNFGTAKQRRREHTDYSKPTYKNNALKNVEKMKKAVIQLFKGVKVAEFSSGKEAYLATGVNHSHILEVCSGKRKTAGGYTWQYREG